ncbi:hypothetical protein [Prevotella melaninogenica]|uniref:hypothetical protein n=1 Tax=Prevotella melaninogenica TaxID=28132 RepID=UPI001BAD6BC1|nr:hypothetical protein [Prevotella melaninogenica]QUB66067.1 hypothetical protein J5A57_02940 [Prevotella melaninogenica]
MDIVTIGNESGEHVDGILRINRKSDFPLGIKLIRGGEVVVFPDCNFTVKATAGSGFTTFKAERRNRVCSNCQVADKQLIIFFDNHNLGNGRVKIEVSIDYPDDNFSDGFRRETFTATSNIELVDDNGDALKLAMPDPIVVEKEVIKEKKSILVWQI